MSARPGNSLLALVLESLAQADDALKRDLAAHLRPYLADALHLCRLRSAGRR